MLLALITVSNEDSLIFKILQLNLYKLVYKLIPWDHKNLLINRYIIYLVLCIVIIQILPNYEITNCHFSMYLLNHNKFMNNKFMNVINLIK